jgi:hypothetical protein
VRLIETGRDPTGAGEDNCPEKPIVWILDYPSRRWADDHRGGPRLRQLPLRDRAAAVGGPWGVMHAFFASGSRDCLERLRGSLGLIVLRN